MRRDHQGGPVSSSLARVLAALTSPEQLPPVFGDPGQSHGGNPVKQQLLPDSGPGRILCLRGAASGSRNKAGPS